MNTLNTQSSSQPFAHDLTDVELVAAAQQGDPRAFERIMRQHNRLLFRSARSILKNDDDTEDAVQAAYLSAWRALGSFRAEAKLATWLVRIVVNESLGRLRRAARRLFRSTLPWTRMRRRRGHGWNTTLTSNPNGWPCAHRCGN